MTSGTFGLEKIRGFVCIVYIILTASYSVKCVEFGSPQSEFCRFLVHQSF